MANYSLFERHQTADIFRITKVEFDFVEKVFPLWYSVVNKTRMCCHYHIHQHMEILYIAHGRVDFQVNGTTYELSDNDVLIINSFEAHSAVIPQDCQKVLYYAINIDLDSLEGMPIRDLKVIANALLNGHGVYANQPSDKEIYRAVSDCIKGMIENSEGANEILQYACFLRLFAALGEPIILSPRQEYERTGEFIREVVLYIQSTPLQDISLESAAEYFSYNKAYFTTLFKKNFGMSFVDYLNNYKITLAKGYIKSGNYNLNDVAEKAGFNYYSNFFKKFKIITGITPSEFVESHRKNADGDRI